MFSTFNFPDFISEAKAGSWTLMTSSVASSDVFPLKKNKGFFEEENKNLKKRIDRFKSFEHLGIEEKMDTLFSLVEFQLMK